MSLYLPQCQLSCNRPSIHQPLPYTKTELRFQKYQGLLLSRLGNITGSSMTTPSLVGSLIGCLFESFHSLREAGSHQISKGLIHV